MGIRGGVARNTLSNANSVCFNLPFDSQVCNLGNQASASTNGAA